MRLHAVQSDYHLLTYRQTGTATQLTLFSLLGGSGADGSGRVENTIAQCIDNDEDNGGKQGGRQPGAEEHLVPPRKRS